MDKDFTLDDFRKQFQAIRQMGTKDMIARMPGMAGTVPEGQDPEEGLQRIERMIDAMTDAERADPDRIDAAARERIAAAAGTEPEQVEQFLTQFAEFRVMWRQMATMDLWERIQTVASFRTFKPFRPPPQS